MDTPLVKIIGNFIEPASDAQGMSQRHSYIAQFLGGLLLVISRGIVLLLIGLFEKSAGGLGPRSQRRSRPYADPYSDVDASSDWSMDENVRKALYGDRSPILTVSTECNRSPILTVSTECNRSPILTVSTECNHSPILTVSAECKLSWPLAHSFIHSFIASIYIAPLQVGLLRGAPNPNTTKTESP